VAEPIAGRSETLGVEGARELQLRDQPELQRGVLFLVVGLVFFAAILVVLDAFKSPGVVPWLLVSMFVAGAVLVLSNPVPRRVRRVRVTSDGIVLTTAGGRDHTIAWGQPRIFIDVVVADRDGTSSPGPVVHWGEFGLPVSWLTVDAAADLIEVARGRGLRVSEGVRGTVGTRAYTAEIRSARA
jgi:hypothetical protein